MERLPELFDPDVIMRAPPGWPEPGPFVGRNASMAQFAQVRETLQRDSIRLVSDLVAAGDRVLARVDWQGIGRGAEGHMAMTVVWTVRRRLIFGVEYFWDHAEALEAVGLSE